MPQMSSLSVVAICSMQPQQQPLLIIAKISRNSPKVLDADFAVNYMT
jgi:hypothetical protein